VVDEDDEYKERFISSLAQVVYDIDVNIRKHKYGKIKKYTKYSVDIFQMGRGTNDKRCSRIFYYKEKSVIHFYEYNPDFH
jgi:DNA-binding transcriptional regulator WhiA